MRAFGTRMFSYNKDSRSFVGEISTMDCTVADLQQGFMLISQRTGATVKYSFVETVRDKEGDITHWTFKEQGKHNTHVIIFND
ncbi:MAG TPA: hypothetical protein VFM18_17830 [Methanosarcina sp.]|nr:hypothetical protein [Methanosarcina sp.]